MSAQAPKPVKDKVKISVFLDPETHVRLRVLCATVGISISQRVESLIIKSLANGKKKSTI
jgi:hypothetical protein